VGTAIQNVRCNAEKLNSRRGAALQELQAGTASRELSRYLLCVVDLRNATDEDLDADWTASKVERLARIIYVGDKVEKTCLLVEEAKYNSVGIRNDSALRYEVPVSVWETGATISQWIASLNKSHLSGFPSTFEKPRDCVVCI
jgi:hypothetical protein